MKLHPCALVIYFLTISIVTQHTSATADDKSAPLTLERVLDNAEPFSAAELRGPGNSQLLAELREYALTTHRYNAVLPMLRIGDPEVIGDAIQRFRARDTRYNTEKALAESKNPDVIALIGDELNREERANHMQVHGEFILNALSVETAGTIKKIILDSSVFSLATQGWARSLTHQMSLDTFRTAMRIWWDQNKALLRAKRYSEVSPPT